MRPPYTLQALLGRVQFATGIDRELDAEIALAFGWRLSERANLWMHPEGWTPVEPFESLPHFTGSTDTATTLVGHVRGESYVEVGLALPARRGRAKIGKREWIQAANPALAVVAALLAAQLEGLA